MHIIGISQDRISKDLSANQKNQMVHRKLLAIQDCCNGLARKAVAAKYNVSTVTIRDWINKYEKNGVKALLNKQFVKHTKLSQVKLVELRNALSCNPLELGLKYSAWDTQLLTDYIFDNFHIKVSQSYCKQMLKSSHSNYKSTDYLSKDDFLSETYAIIQQTLSRNERVVFYFTFSFGRLCPSEIYKNATNLFALVAIVVGNDYQHTYYDVACGNQSIIPLDKTGKTSRNNNVLQFITRVVKKEAKHVTSVLLVMSDRKLHHQAISKYYKQWTPKKNSKSFKYQFRVLYTPNDVQLFVSVK
jgi:Transposase and inactivated derivatives